LALPDGDVLVFRPRNPGGGDTTAVALTPAGQERWRAELQGGPPRAYVVDARTGTVYAGMSGYTDYVAAISPSGDVRRVVSGPGYGDPLAVGPDGTLYLGNWREEQPDAAPLVAVDPTDGRLLWRFAPSTTPAYAGPPVTAPDGTVLVSVGHFLYRLKVDGKPPPPSVARLTVRPSRFRFAGFDQRCAPPAGTSCSPATPRGAVAQLTLPRGVPRGPVQVTLRRVDTGNRAKAWSATVQARPGPQWFTIRAETEGCGRCYGKSPTVKPGRYVLIASWKGANRRRQVGARVEILPTGPRPPGV
jgi:hypothetical protein